MKIFIIIPAFNEEKQIDKLLKKLKAVSYPVVVVDDGSTDKTNQIVKKAGVKILKHKINLGNSKGAAMKTGAEYAFGKGADAVIFLDADGQHDPKDIKKFVDKLNEGYQVVLGSRNFNMQVPLVRYLGNKFASIVIALLFGVYVSDLLCGFRALTKESYKRVYWESIGYGVETEMVVKMAKARLKHCEVPVASIYYDHIKGVTLLDAINILFDVIRWRITG